MNKKIVIVVAALLVGVIGAIVVGNAYDSSSESETTTMRAIPENLNEVIQTAIERQPMPDVIVMDVRTDEEWNAEHATNALHWGLEEHLKQDALPPLGKDMEIYVYCRSGNRSAQAIEILEDAGYTNLTNIRGLEDWKNAGGQTTTGIDGDRQ